MENMSVTSYNREFKRQLNTSPTKYIIGKRIQLAKELLETTNLSITEISLTCGYNDINFFSRVFKETSGCSPTSYKQKINADF
jgi:AraC-like DNA-binding protein